MILEKRIVEYDKNFKYEKTIKKEFMVLSVFDTETYINDNMEWGVEYFTYKNHKDLKANKYIDRIICNNSLSCELQRENCIKYGLSKEETKKCLLDIQKYE